MNKLVITEQAYNDIDLIVGYISNNNKPASKKILKLLHQACYLLVEFPNIGIKRPDFTYKNIMFYIVAKKYLIAYQIRQNEVLILRILSAYQDICSLFWLLL